MKVVIIRVPFSELKAKLGLSSDCEVIDVTSVFDCFSSIDIKIKATSVLDVNESELIPVISLYDLKGHN